MRFIQLASEKQGLILDYNADEDHNDLSFQSDEMNSEIDEITVTPCKMKPIS